MNFYKELEREFKNAGLQGRIIEVSDELKPTSKDYKELEKRIYIKTEENRNMMYLSGIYASNGMLCGNMEEKYIKNEPNIIFGTGNYYNVKKGNTVSITGDGGNAWGYFGPAYKKLAPRLETYTPYAEKLEELQKLKKDLNKVKEYLEIRKQIEDKYIKSYYDIRLKDLDVNELLYTLNEKYGNNIILLCHEPVDEFCHRRLVADYIELITGKYIPEVSIDDYGNVKKLIPLRYKNRLKKIMR